MKDVSRASGAVDSLRVAVLAALNLADECFRLRAGGREQALERRRSSTSARCGSPASWERRSESNRLASRLARGGYHPRRGSLLCP